MFVQLDKSYLLYLVRSIGIFHFIFILHQMCNCLIHRRLAPELGVTLTCETFLPLFSRALEESGEISINGFNPIHGFLGGRKIHFRINMVAVVGIVMVCKFKKNGVHFARRLYEWCWNLWKKNSGQSGHYPVKWIHEL